MQRSTLVIKTEDIKNGTVTLRRIHEEQPLISM